MKLTRWYDRTRFSADVIREGLAVLFAGLQGTRYGDLQIQMDEGEWQQDTEEEFFADYRRSAGDFHVFRALENYTFLLLGRRDSVAVTIGAPSRARIHEAFEVFDRNHDASRLPDPLDPTEQAPRPVVFIGHGSSPAWRDLSDHLRDKHGVVVEAYEIGARAGHVIRDILECQLAVRRV